MSSFERADIPRIREQGIEVREPVIRKGDPLACAGKFGQGRAKPLLRRVQRRPARGEQMSLVGFDPGLLREPQADAEPLDERRDVLERTAEEHDGPLQRAPAGQSPERLPRDGVEHARGDVLWVGARVEQRPHIGLREDGAPRGDGIDPPGAPRQPVHARRPHAEHPRHRVDETAGAACARRVHPLLQAV